MCRIDIRTLVGVSFFIYPENSKNGYAELNLKYAC